MSLPHALLTALIERPSSGSDLAVRFDKSIAYFWHATHQQIYRELARLEAARLIESLPEEATRGRKRAYRILPAGRRELTRWVEGEVEPALLRDELMVRLWAEAAVGPTGLDAQVRRRMEGHQAQLALYLKIQARDYPGPRQDRETALRHLVLRAGILHERNWIALLADALEILQSSPGQALP